RLQTPVLAGDERARVVAVQADPGPHQVVMMFGVSDYRGRVGGVPEARIDAVLLHPGECVLELRELTARESLVGLVGGREMGERALEPQAPVGVDGASK